MTGDRELDRAMETLAEAVRFIPPDTAERALKLMLERVQRGIKAYDSEING